MINELEEFVVIMYDRSSSAKIVNDARLDLFARKHRPSRAALVEHIKRSVLEAGHTWGQSLCKWQTLPSPSRCGWEKDFGGFYVPHWTSLPPIAASCQELLKCGCKISCSGSCKCLSLANLALLFAAATAPMIKSCKFIKELQPIFKRMRSVLVYGLNIKIYHTTYSFS